MSPALEVYAGKNSKVNLYCANLFYLLTHHVLNISVSLCNSEESCHAGF